MSKLRILALMHKALVPPDDIGGADLSKVGIGSRPGQRATVDSFGNYSLTRGRE